MKWEIGQELVHQEQGEGLYGDESARLGQAYWESQGWRAVDQAPDAQQAAPAVERVLADGWSTGESGHCHACPTAGFLQSRYSRPSGKGGNDLLCAEHAEKAGAFAEPAQAAPKCDHTKNAKCVEPGGCAWANEIRKDAASPTPAQTEKAKDAYRALLARNAAEKPPRCEYRKGDHEGTPVERVMFYNGGPRRMFACDACYLFSEENFTTRWPIDRAAKPLPRVGLVPQAVAPFVGILGSRGMRGR